jgi:hypothetical protein
VTPHLQGTKGAISSLEDSRAIEKEWEKERSEREKERSEREKEREEERFEREKERSEREKERSERENSGEEQDNLILDSVAYKTPQGTCN